VNLQDYLDRIRYQGETTPTLDTLRALHRAHMYAVPFENLDIHWHRPILLDEQHLYQKIVTNNRGGFCYEQNTVFAWALREIGFELSMLEARVHRGDGVFGVGFDHMALMVNMEERWLADVGFGESFIEPLQMDSDLEQVQSVGSFRVMHDGVVGQMRRRGNDGHWQDEYQFYLEPRNLPDFQSGADYHQTSPESHFTQGVVCSLTTPTGRITLTQNRLITRVNGVREEQELSDEAAFQDALQRYFGVSVPV
jgi:N-hydroxyarylamine O-acetyltransferase